MSCYWLNGMLLSSQQISAWASASALHSVRAGVWCPVLVSGHVGAPWGREHFLSVCTRMPGTLVMWQGSIAKPLRCTWVKMWHMPNPEPSP